MTSRPREQRLWIIAEQFFPDETGTAHYLNKIAAHVAKSLTVIVITCQMQHALGNLPRVETRDGLHIRRTTIPPFDKNKILQRLLKILCTTTVLVAGFLKHARRGDCVLVGTNPVILPYLVIPLAKLFGIKIVLRVDDVLSGTVVATGLLSQKNLIWRLLHHLERFSYQRADIVVTMGRDMQARVVGQIPTQAANVVTIPNWADTSEVQPGDKANNQLRKTVNPDDKFLVLIAGNIGRVQGIPTLMDAVAMLKAESGVAFLFVGAGALIPYVNERIVREKLNNISIMPLQPRDRQNEFLNAGDVALLTLSKGMLGVGSPSRLYNYMAAGKPVIGVVEAGSEAGLVIREHDIGWLAEPGDPAQIVAAIYAAKTSSDLAAIGRRARDAALKYYRADLMIERYRLLLTDIRKKAS